MKLKQKAKGDPSVQLENRVYFSCTLPGGKGQRPLYFHENTVVGVVIDRVSQTEGITNTNNLPGNGANKLSILDADGKFVAYNVPIISLARSEAGSVGPHVVYGGRVTLHQGPLL